MRMLFRFILVIIANAVGFWCASIFIDGFIITNNILSLLITALVLTILNFFLRPLFKLLFGPALLFTFGTFMIIIHAGILFILDIISDAITINGVIPLFFGTLIIGAVNIILHLPKKSD